MRASIRECFSPMAVLSRLLAGTEEVVHGESFRVFPLKTVKPHKNSETYRNPKYALNSLATYVMLS